MSVIIAPLKPFAANAYTVTTTNITGGTRTKFAGVTNDAVGNVILVHGQVDHVGNVYTLTNSITVDSPAPHVALIGSYSGGATLTILGPDAQGRQQVKAQASGKTAHVTPKTIAGVHAGADMTSAINALLKAKGLM